MVTIIQDTWDQDDDQDLLFFLRDKNSLQDYKILNKKQILDLENFENINVIFADTDIIQELLLAKNCVNFIIPDNYPSCFQNKKVDFSNKQDFEKFSISIFCKTF